MDQRDSIILLLAVLLLLELAWLIARQEITLRFLKHQTQKKYDMFTIVSHQLRTHLTTIRWYMELLLNRGFGKFKLSQLELLHTISIGAYDMLHLLDRFLEVSWTEHELLAFRPVAIDVQKGMQRVIDSLADSTEERGHTISIQMEEERCLVYFDLLLFHAIFHALLSNAIVYTPPHGTIRIVISERGKSIVLSVEDTGIGVRAEDEQKLFSRFYRGKNARTLHPMGSGLGLYCTKQLLDKSRGSIRFKPNKPRGAIFSITLPKAEED